ncbi:hypothetical protein BpHYR1_035644 [Brachionus plicatilis]|uniref:Uncharacterized protein n=1 Tax=Brachionus plicatilis TaxID=10195 RepID=A0A3M7RPZ0_BRAPC|nr:hypothetical protein BpHYR1_035644 [Brachionus plicatilis]
MFNTIIVKKARLVCKIKYRIYYLKILKFSFDIFGSGNFGIHCVGCQNLNRKFEKSIPGKMDGTIVIQKSF